MLNWFDYHGHICLTFDLLGLSVFDFLVSHKELVCYLAVCVVLGLVRLVISVLLLPFILLWVVSVWNPYKVLKMSAVHVGHSCCYPFLV